MIKKGENMILFTEIVKNKYKNYLNKDTKLSRDVRDGKLFRIINGLYENDPNTPGYLLASS